MVVSVVIHVDETYGQSGKLEEASVLRAINNIPERILSKYGYFVTDENLGMIKVIAEWNAVSLHAGKEVQLVYVAGTEIKPDGLDYFYLQFYLINRSFE